MTHYIGIISDIMDCTRALLCDCTDEYGTYRDPFELGYTNLDMTYRRVRFTKSELDDVLYSEEQSKWKWTESNPKADTIVYLGSSNKIIGYTHLMEILDFKELMSQGEGLEIRLELDFTACGEELDVAVIQSYRQHNADTYAGTAHKVAEENELTRSDINSLPQEQKSYATTARDLMNIPTGESKILHYSGHLMWSVNTTDVKGVKDCSSDSVTLEYIGIGYTLQFYLKDYICPGYQNGVSGSYYHCDIRKGSTISSGIVFLGWYETSLMIKPIYCHKWDDPIDPHGIVELNLLKCDDGNLAISSESWYGTDGTDIYKGVVLSGNCIPQSGESPISINAYNLPTTVDQTKRYLRVAHNILGETLFYQLDKDSGALTYSDKCIQYVMEKFSPENGDLYRNPIIFADQSLLIQRIGSQNSDDTYTFSIYHECESSEISSQKVSVVAKWVRPISSGLIIYKTCDGSFMIYDLTKGKEWKLYSPIDGYTDSWLVTKCSSTEPTLGMSLIDGWLGSFTQLVNNNVVKLL